MEEKLIERYISFISENKTERECTKSIVRIAKENGFEDINTLDKLVNMVPDLFNKIMNLISEKTGRSQSESRNNSSGGADASAAEFYAPEE